MEIISSNVSIILANINELLHIWTFKFRKVVQQHS